MSLQNLQLEIADAICSGDADLCIYQNNMMVHLNQAIKNTYPLIAKLVGEDFFRVAAKEYIKRYPSRTGNLNEYGEYFSDFLAEYEPVKDLIYLAEVAQFEWACHTLLTAPHHTGLDLDVLKSVSPDHYDQIHFVLHPACRVMKCYYPMLRIIDLCQGEVDDTDTIDLGEEGINLLIYRRELDISLISLSNEDFAFLNALAEGLSLATALETAINIDSNFSLSDKLPYWVKEKVIVDCYLGA